jgi:uncharacterized protein (DUF885 family)
MLRKVCFMVSLGIASAAGAAPSDDLTALIADYEKYTLSQDPVLAARYGDREALKRWPDNSPTAVAARKKALEGFKARVAGLKSADLPPDSALNVAILGQQIDRSLDIISFDEARFSFTADDGFFNLPDYVARSTTIQNRADADAWLARLEGIPAFYATETANARRGLTTGFIQPKPAVEAALTSVKAQADAPGEESSLLLPFENLPASLSPNDQKTLRARAREVVTTKIKPAQRELLTFMEKTYLPKARTTLGIESVSNGKAYYAFAARRYTTTKLTPDEISAIGVKEVARIRSEMEKIIAEVGFRGTFKEFQASLRTDPQFYVTTREALLEKASEISKRIDDQLPRYFGLLPRLTYGVRPVPREIEDSYTSGRYWTGSPEQGIAGGYMVNTSHLNQRPLFELPALTLHEAVPGHHLQIALALENTKIPVFRRNDEMTAYVEGWALYAERLGIEMGIYRSPYEQFGRLSMEMWRACRLVVDTGLHHKGWTRDQAIAYLADNTALAQKNVVVEVDRYIGWPGQALAYKIGELKIRELRERAEKALGERFDVRKFHDVILGEGPLPLDLLEQRVDGWIASPKT